MQIFDPFTAPFILPQWHGRIVQVPAPLECRVYGREWPAGGMCALWRGWSNGKGHGIVRVKGRRRYLHRYSYACFHGIEIDQLDIMDHLCRNRPCFNPYHLEDETYLENYRRGDGVNYQFKKAEEYTEPPL